MTIEDMIREIVNNEFTKLSLELQEKVTEKFPSPHN